MQYSEQLLDRYEKVATLAKRGEGGERTNAANNLERMEGKYPGISYQARLRTTQRQKSDHPTPGPYDASNGAFGGAGSRDSVWNKWAGMAESAFAWATEVAGEVASLDYARRCANEFVEIQAKNLSSAKYQVSARLPLRDLYACAQHLTPAQKHAFAQFVGTRVAEAVLRSLMEEGD